LLVVLGVSPGLLVWHSLHTQTGKERGGLFTNVLP